MLVVALMGFSIGGWWGKVHLETAKPIDCMTVHKTYADFVQLIRDGDYNGYRVCFEHSTYPNDNWTGGDCFEYLANLERHKSETGVSIHYLFWLSDDHRVDRVETFIHFPEENGIQERVYVINWVVQYN